MGLSQRVTNARRSFLNFLLCHQIFLPSTVYFQKRIRPPETYDGLLVKSLRFLIEAIRGPKSLKTRRRNVSRYGGRSSVDLGFVKSFL